MLKAVLFDLDNTLYDYDYAHSIAIKEVFHELQRYISISYSNFKRLFNLSRAEIHRELAGTASAHNRVLYFQRLIEKTHNKLEPSIILKLYNCYWNNILKSMNLSVGSLEVLRYCKKNDIKTAIVSDLTTDIQLKKIQKLKISKYIDHLVTSEEAGSEKPHSIMFLMALNKLDTSPKKAIMVGDNTIADIEGANFVGLKTVLLKKGKMAVIPEEDYQKPSYTIKKIIKLIDIIKELNNSSNYSNILDSSNTLNTSNTSNLSYSNPSRISSFSFSGDKGYIKFKCYLLKSKPLSYSKIKEINDYRQRLYNLKLIGAYKNKIGYGNISIKVSDSKNNNNNNNNPLSHYRKKNNLKKIINIIITGSGSGNNSVLDNSDYSLVTKYDLENNELFCKGLIKASSESMTHMAIYECSDSIGAVIHVHSKFIWSHYLNKLPTTSIQAEYGTPEIAKEIKRLFNQTDFKKKKIAILGGHKEGIIVFGKDLKEAYNILLKYKRLAEKANQHKNLITK